MERFEKAISLFDAYNKQDPNYTEWEGTTYPTEYFYAVQLYDWVKKLEPEASEWLLLAARAAHIGRWKSPRENYPLNKPGYYKWRTELSKFHADTTGELMQEAGYNGNEIKEVQSLIRKEQLRTNYEVQILEDALCLVFLQFQYEDFLLKHNEEKVIRILQKTWNKMNDKGKEAALGLSFSEKGKVLIGKALA